MTAVNALYKSRDLNVYLKGKTTTVAIQPALQQAGWTGGSGLQWADGPSLTVGQSDGVRGAGLALWGSNESSDAWTSLSGSAIAYGFVVVGSGSWIVSTKSFELYTWDSRQAGPLVPLVYTARARLRWSLRGLLTIEDEWDESGDPRGPNPNIVGQVIQRLPTDFLTVSLSL